MTEGLVSVHPAFDRILGGGLVTGVLTHVFGPPSSGKTNFALMACVSASRSGKVIYVDTEGGFSAERLKQVSGEQFKEVLEKVLLIEPTTFEEQKVALSKVADLTAKGGVSLVVLDSVAMLYRIKEDRDIRQFGRVLAQLLRIARKYAVPVIMLNQVYTDIDSGKITPVGGSINEYWSKVMLEASVADDGTRSLTLKKHLHVKEGLRLDYRITESGIQSLTYSSAAKNQY